jgi:hypothetical protein
LTLIDRPKSYQDRIKAVYKNKAMERVPMDPSFREGWAYHNDTAYMVHFFTPSTRGMLVSLCHQHRQYPIWVIPEEEGDIRCGHCIRVLERRQRVAKIRRERGLRRKLDARVAAFLADPALGPRLYGCPVCDSVYEGMAPDLFPCSDGGHEPTLVVELAKKDTWTKDKRTSDAL